MTNPEMSNPSVIRALQQVTGYERIDLKLFKDPRRLRNAEARGTDTF